MDYFLNGLRFNEVLGQVASSTHWQIISSLRKDQGLGPNLIKRALVFYSLDDERLDDNSEEEASLLIP